MAKKFINPLIFHQAWLSKPDFLSLMAVSGQRYPFLLDSSSAGTQGRYTILMGFVGQTLDFDHWAASFSAQNLPTDLPFIGGYFAYLPYGFAQEVEPKLQLSEDTFLSPRMVEVDAAMIWDAQLQRLTLVAQKLHQMQKMQQDIRHLQQAYRGQKLQCLAWSEEDPQQFLAGVERIHQYIVAGDIFQVNLSRQWRVELAPHTSAVDIYAALRTANPAPFSALAVFGHKAVISSSPERLIEKRGQHLATRPIAGTRKRGLTPEEDAQLLQELRNTPKELAEHIMLIDLERNDLGRVAQPGSVKVDELMAIESYAHVHHIVSNVVAQGRKDVSAAAIIKAVFPGGTITGCPKVRCMEIIQELEGQSRGAYTGSLGYVSLNGDMDLNILIRTFALEGQVLTFRAGAGIVKDSQGDKELAETRHKARGLLRALGDLHA